MKKLIFLALAIVLFTACEKQMKRYTQQSPEIETVKMLIDNYNKKTIDISIYADSSKTFYNTNDNPMSPAEVKTYHQEREALYTSRMFSNEDPEYEMVLTDDGDTWVNCWLEWNATLAGNGKKIEMPIHLTYQFVDGKIVKEYGYWDPTEIVLNLQTIEADKEKLANEDQSEE
ncbi:nuclear transport factor 2 family protein [Aureibaculum marinum]|uniref:Nuclear transport factor 2 family protein n=1 Tax=Aureibaculum marinum TaxID=2487930 RepID=A0A3N4NIE6_9FLAO|nr:nuclear transport factor 2 family protein [Aureibaculum marinum]RPD94458.1 nuclear transport factor 2 family protein [Aureibaculum marinum]